MKHIYLTITNRETGAELLIVKKFEGFDKWFMNNPFFDKELKEAYQNYKNNEPIFGFWFTSEYRSFSSPTHRMRITEGE